MITNLLGSASGWTMHPIPRSEGTDYVVIQDKDQHDQLALRGIVSNATYSDDCRGTIRDSDNKSCTITNMLTNPKASLRIITYVDNRCEPKSEVCSSIMPQNYNTKIYRLDRTGDGYMYRSMGPDLPGSYSGWTLNLTAHHVGFQYHIYQPPMPGQDGPYVGSLRSQPFYSYDCNGILRQGDSKVCQIINTVTNSSSTTTSTIGKSSR
jgi:hypothetical protein